SENESELEYPPLSMQDDSSEELEPQVAQFTLGPQPGAWKQVPSKHSQCGSVSPAFRQHAPCGVSGAFGAAALSGSEAAAGSRVSFADEPCANHATVTTRTNNMSAL